MFTEAIEVTRTAFTRQTGAKECWRHGASRVQVVRR